MQLANVRFSKVCKGTLDSLLIKQVNQYIFDHVQVSIVSLNEKC